MTAAVSSARPGGNAHTTLFALSGDTVLEPVTVVVNPDDDPQFMRMAFAAHQPCFGHITVHPTPLAGETIHLAHDLIRSLGKHLPLPDQYSGRSRFANTTDSWHIAAAWSLALGINRLTVCRAHLLRLPKWRRLFALSACTRTRLTLLCNGPIPQEALPLLDSVPHRILDRPDTAADHWRTPAGLQELDCHPRWQHHAAFPPGDD
ncbi:hypothetical protein [Streptomyces misionensis]|uniref:hypothetical protein n=1 Tax=Streptomyces misionensis TaxID=67331 RepID=UPI0033DE458F